MFNKDKEGKDDAVKSKNIPSIVPLSSAFSFEFKVNQIPSISSKFKSL